MDTHDELIYTFFMALNLQSFYLYFSVKELNRHIISVVNFVITVGAAFAFGYKATDYAVWGPNKFAFVSILFLC